MRKSQNASENRNSKLSLISLRSIVIVLIQAKNTFVTYLQNLMNDFKSYEK